MSPTCPECEKPFTGRRAETRASRVCQACGHAFLLNPDGSTESIKTRVKPITADGEDDDASASTDESEATEANQDGDAAEMDATPPESPEQDQSAIDGEPSPASPESEPLSLAAPDATDGTPESAEGQTTADDSPEAQGWTLPSPPSPVAIVPELASTSSGQPVALLAGMLVLGVGLGFGAHYIPGLTPEPPPPPPPVEVPVPEPVALPPQMRFIQADEPLWAGPLSDGAYANLAVRQKGSAVLTTSAEVGSFVLVHDAMGRAGFVSATALADKRPDAAFVDCARAPFESEDACKARAAKQHEACESGCSDQGCTDACKESLAACAPACAELGLQPEPAADERGASKKKRARGKKRERRKGKAKAAAADSEDDYFTMP